MPHTLGQAPVVGDQQDGDAGRQAFAEHRLDPRRGVLVEAGRGLVEQQHPRLKQQGADQGQALALAGRGHRHGLGQQRRRQAEGIEPRRD